MARYGAVVDLDGGTRLFVKAILLKRHGDYHELHLMEQYDKIRYLSAKPRCYNHGNGTALMEPDCQGVDTMMIMKVDEDRSLFVALGRDEEEVQAYIDDFIGGSGDCGDETEGEIPQQFKDAISLHKFANNVMKKLESGGRV